MKMILDCFLYENLYLYDCGNEGSLFMSRINTTLPSIKLCENAEKEKSKKMAISLHEYMSDSFSNLQKVVR